MTRIIRRLVVVSVMLAMLAGSYLLGGKYLWPPADNNTIETVGIIEAPEVDITSRIAGRISQFDLEEGDQVERGQVVCRIEDVDLRNQLAKARADLATSQADLDDAARTMARERELYAKHVISAQERDDAMAKLERSSATVDSGKAQVQFYLDQLADTQIIAPISGLIVNKALRVGEWVTPGMPVLTVDDLSTIWARVDVQETDLGSIRIGSPATVTMPTAPPLVFTGAVMAIGQEGQFATMRDVRRGRQDIRTFYVKVRVLQSSGELKPGMTAEVSFARRDQPASGNSSPGSN